MAEEKPIFESEAESESHDPDETPIRDRKCVTQPYDLVAESLIAQINGGEIFLRPLNNRPRFQRKSVWSDSLASRLIESILLNVPVPPCYLSQNDEYELDVIDGQQRLFSIFRFLENQFKLKELEILSELDGSRFFELPARLQRQLRTHTLRCVVITNESHPEIKFDVFERLNTNTVPLNAQELRNCVYRGTLNDLLGLLADGSSWLSILGRRQPDVRLRDEEIILRFFGFLIHGIEKYRTPQKHWLNDVAEDGRKYSEKRIAELDASWTTMLGNSLIWFDKGECFRRPGSRAINRALFDLVSQSAAKIAAEKAFDVRNEFRSRYANLMNDAEFQDLISRAVDHTRRTRRRFEIWNQRFGDLIQ